MLTCALASAHSQVQNIKGLKTKSTKLSVVVGVLEASMKTRSATHLGNLDTFCDEFMK